MTCQECKFFKEIIVLFAVAVDSDGSPVSVSWSSDARRNIIVWMDHRAVEQAERINSRNSPVLQYCGGGVSPEMQAPKVSDVFVESIYRKTKNKIVFTSRCFLLFSYHLL